MKLAIFLAIVWPAFPQFSGLSTTDDGSTAYFSSPLRLRNTAQSFYPKLFRVADQAPVLFRAQDPGPSLGWYVANFYGLVLPQVSSDGSILAFTGTRTCSGGSGCLSVQRAQGVLVDAKGDPILSAYGYVNISPNAEYALFFARNTWARVLSPAELISVKSGSRVEVAYSIPADARRRVANDGTVAIYADRGLRLWRASGEETLKGASIGPIGSTEPRLLAGSDGRRFVYDTPGGLARYDRSTATEERLSGNIPISIDINVDATVVAWVDPQDLQIHLTPERQVPNVPEGVAEVALSGNGRVVYAVTRQGRLLRRNLASGEGQEIVSRTPWVDSSRLSGPQASIFGTVAPGSAIPLIGSGLAASSVSAAAPLPRELGGVRVRVGGVDAAVQSVSPELVWIQIPWEVPVSVTARFEFLSGDSLFETPPGSVNVQPSAPAAYGTVNTASGYNFDLLAVHGDWSGLVTAEKPAAPGEVIVLYFSGLGPVTPPVATGEAAPAEVPARLVNPLLCQFWAGGGSDVAVLFAGLAPAMVGVYQANVRVPSGLQSSRVSISCSSGSGVSSTIGSVYVRE